MATKESSPFCISDLLDDKYRGFLAIFTLQCWSLAQAQCQLYIYKILTLSLLNKNLFCGKVITCHGGKDAVKAMKTLLVVMTVMMTLLMSGCVVAPPRGRPVIVRPIRPYARVVVRPAPRAVVRPVL